MLHLGRIVLRESAISSVRPDQYYKLHPCSYGLLADVWFQVQRVWVYLEGIFSGSADIKHLLPVESSRFQNINNEFMTILKKVYKSPFILDVLAIPGVQKGLDRLAEQLDKVQRALTEYLERERASFPRFYFVGDEDLLEIIGNSKDILRVMKHLKKMFAGIATISLDDDLTRIEGMISREGETVPFRTPILLKDYPKINDWLAKIESEMQISLALLLSDAVSELHKFYSNGASLEPATLLSWIEKYPAQLVSLAMQVVWTSSVESSLSASRPPESTLAVILEGLDLLADIVLSDLNPNTRQKCEHLITELVHQRDVTRSLVNSNVVEEKAFSWLSQMRFYLDSISNVASPLDRLTIRMADAIFPYGWEYLGVPDKLVQTPLTDRVYLTLTQALDNRLGGAPFGPAGTGKFCLFGARWTV
jgi:dynein heavy chain 1